MDRWKKNMSLAENVCLIGLVVMLLLYCDFMSSDFSAFSEGLYIYVTGWTGLIAATGEFALLSMVMEIWLERKKMWLL